MTSPPRARPTEAIETLRKMRELLSVPERWTQRRCARNENGFEVPPDSPGAVCFCLIGAAGKVTGNFGLPLDVLDKLTFPEPCSVWQDAPGRTHAEVIDLLDRAIAQSEGT